MSNNNKHYFHFTLGPVQGFVSQARRTRDFWAGSFILSWLSAVAIQATCHQGGKISFPVPDDNYMRWLTGSDKAEGLPPAQGSIPNRFKGLIAEVPADFQPGSVVDAVQEAWKALADLVWENDLGHLSPSCDTAMIWDRQVENFWDMSWVITENNDSSALDKRKNWRSYTPPAEPGIKCMMMDGWQELSGTASPRRKELAVFWEGIRDQSDAHGIKTDLKEKEALCAMAFIKRRFSRHFEQLEHPMQQGWQLRGWKVPSAVPSVSYMAAIHWLENALINCQPELLDNFTKEAKILTGQYGEWDTDIKCLADADKANYKTFRSLDGNVFFDTQLENKNVFEDKKQAQKVAGLLRKICKTEGVGKPSPFYAVLLMDGDSLGKHMSDPDKQGIISQALNKFTQKVPDIIYQNNGFLIYAGGDDVLAILPVEDAIPCAIAIKNTYSDCFTQQNANFVTSISAAIEFVHIKTALIKILRDAHNLLDNIAKEQTGRDALAVRVWKPGGKQLEWTQPWDRIINEKSGKSHIEEIAETFQHPDMDEQFSNSFFYKIRERFNLLNPEKNGGNVLDKDAQTELMAMEYINSGKSDLSDKKYSVAERKRIAKERLEKLLKQCRPQIRKLDDSDKPDFEETGELKIDAALLVRFLTQKGVE